MKTKKKPLFAMLVAMVMSLGIMGQFAEDKESANLQQLAWGHNWAAEHSEGAEHVANKALGYTYEGVASGLSSGVITPTALVCYGGAAVAGL